jgi:hypothetical protein
MDKMEFKDLFLRKPVFLWENSAWQTILLVKNIGKIFINRRIDFVRLEITMAINILAMNGKNMSTLFVAN